MRLYRKIIKRYPKKPGEYGHRELLECGHIIGTDSYYKAEARDCWKCRKGLPVEIVQADHL